FTSADLVSAKSAADRESKLATEIAKLTTALKEEKQASVNAAATVKKLREEMAELAKLEKFKTETEILRESLKRARASLVKAEKRAEDAASLVVRLEESEKLREKLAAQAAEMAQREAEAARIAKLPPRLEAAAPENPPVQDATPEELCKSAVECEKNHRPSVALWFYRYAMQLYPQEAAPAEGAARLLLDYGENKTAEDCAAAARAAGADSLNLIVLHGRALNRQGEWSKAYLVLEPVRLKGENHEFSLELAIACAGAGRIELAKSGFDALLKQAGERKEAQLAYAYFAKDKLKDRAAAEKAYQSYRKLGGAPEPELDGEFAAPPEEETLAFLASAAAEAEAAADWESAAWFHLRRLDIRRDSAEFAARGAFDLYRAGRYAACAETLMMNQPSEAGMLLLAAARFRLGDFAAATEAAAEYLKNVRSGHAPAPAVWPELAAEAVKLEDNDTTQRAARAVRRAVEAATANPKGEIKK
ncbi:MAG: hypothetical protein PHI35_02890, partial [Victivallaceae bacterium]|nr:hypothetical protein [Victivallaceae bacterium]